MDTPVALFMFNRPQTTRRVFDAIRAAKPSLLLVIADGPRENRLGESEKCAASRQIIEQVDWNCQLLTNYSEVNLGCKQRIASGLNWVFDTVEQAIILEDDCLPHPSFFPFCEELLDRYRDDTRIMSITGQNVQFGRNNTGYSYHFSRFFHCWGWATWRRAWQHYDLEMKLWPKIKDSYASSSIFQDSRTSRYWKTVFQQQYDGKFSTWDYSATFSFLVQNALHVHPSQNLIKNIGFGADATNTAIGAEESRYANMEVFEMPFPLQHPPYVVPNIQADKFTQETHYDPTFLYRVKSKLMKVLKA